MQKATVLNLTESVDLIERALFLDPEHSGALELLKSGGDKAAIRRDKNTRSYWKVAIVAMSVLVLGGLSIWWFSSGSQRMSSLKPMANVQHSEVPQSTIHNDKSNEPLHDVAAQKTISNNNTKKVSEKKQKIPKLRILKEKNHAQRCARSAPYRIDERLIGICS